MRARALFAGFCLIIGTGLPMASAEIESGDTSTEEEICTSTTEEEESSTETEATTSEETSTTEEETTDDTSTTEEETTEDTSTTEEEATEEETTDDTSTTEEETTDDTSTTEEEATEEEATEEEATEEEATEEEATEEECTEDSTTSEEEDPPGEETLETSTVEEPASEPNQAPVAVDDSLTILLDQTVTVDVVANDSDPDGDPLTLVDVSEAAHGTASLADGGILYAPDPGYKGFETLTYTISDGEFAASATLTIQVDPPPDVVDDTAATPQDQAVVIDVLANDTDADGDPITVANVTDPANGTAVINPDQTVTYTPDPGFKGIDTFTYTANDGMFDSLPATVTVLVHSPTRLPADIPFMIDESGSMGDDITAVKNNVDFIASQLEVDLDPRYALVGFGANSTHTGTFGVTGNGHPHTHTDFTDKEGFRAALDQLIASGAFEPGVETTTYAMTNLTGYRLGAGVCAVLITDEDSNYITDQATALAAAKTALDGRGAIWFGVVDPSESGTASEYGPDAGSLSEHTGGQVFAINDFRSNPQPVLDALLRSCVTALVQGINLTPPEASNLTGDPHTVLAIVRDSTGAAVVGVEVTFSITSGPNSGQGAVVTTNASGEASFTYTSSRVGTDTIEASFLDQEQQVVRTDTANKTWRGRPVANDDLATTQQDQPVTIAVLANDTDPEGDALSVTDLTQPSNGAAVVNPDGTVTYTPNAGFVGTDTFTYRATDGDGNSNVATVTVKVEGPPVAVDDSGSTEQGKAITVAVLDNDSDPNADALSVTDLTQPSNGTVVVNPDGTVTYTPNTGFSGSDTFTYRATDGDGNSNVATVTIIVSPLEVQALVIFPDTSVQAETLPLTGIEADALFWLALALLSSGLGMLTVGTWWTDRRPRGRHLATYPGIARGRGA